METEGMVMDKVKIVSDSVEEIHQSIRMSGKKTKQRLQNIQNSLLKEDCNLFELEIEEEK